MPDMRAQLLLVGKLFLLMSVGVLLRKRNIIPEDGKKLLTDLVIHLILPCSIISSFLVELTAEQLLWDKLRLHSRRVFAKIT